MNRQDAPRNPSPILIGVAGGSGSGKTWLARQVCALVGEGAGLVSMDQYFRTEDSPDVKGVNFDHPSHLDIDQLVGDLRKIRAGESVRLPSYDFRRMVQTPEAIELPPCKVVIVEGLFVLSAPIVDLLDFTCFLGVDKDQALLGRLLRDFDERSHDVSQTIDRYQRFVRPSYEVFVAPTRHNADVVIDFTFRRAYFTELLATMVREIIHSNLDVETFSQAVRSDNYRLGYKADESVMPATVDIRELARIYPEHVLYRRPLLSGSSFEEEENEHD
ncbi:uridine kinase family protein [Fimbriimonas ginsengisoli]|uniref:Uridine kinase n=1 Tax=Fimbriimonas ginsengisoli Gsoil 348 TaxID=661478 RepID=A0A068NV26_FIMGI|nr:uridine kinase [Fimbriimonas ginsengisoli]AIE86595.1 uridine kinase [Fimbriimonas ginsengisoli Gsoil 348]